MMKRIMLVMALGLSFTPAVFAAVNLKAGLDHGSKNGQLPLSKISGGAIVCEGEKSLSTPPEAAPCKSGSTGTAGVAR